jgi:hypothetical protein
MPAHDGWRVGRPAHFRLSARRVCSPSWFCLPLVAPCVALCFSGPACLQGRVPSGHAQPGCERPPLGSLPSERLPTGACATPLPFGELNGGGGLVGARPHQPKRGTSCRACCARGRAPSVPRPLAAPSLHAHRCTAPKAPVPTLANTGNTLRSARSTIPPKRRPPPPGPPARGCAGTPQCRWLSRPGAGAATAFTRRTGTARAVCAERDAADPHNRPAPPGRLSPLPLVPSRPLPLSGMH